MDKVKIELNSAGIQALLKSSEIIAALKEPAEGGKITAFAENTTDPEAMETNMKNNAMIKAVGGYFRTNKDGSKKFVKAPSKRKKA